MSTAFWGTGVALALVAFAVYTAGMALAWKLSPYSYVDQTAELVRSIIPVLAVLASIAVIALQLSGVRLLDGLTWSWWALVGVVPSAVLVAGLALAARSREGVNWRLFAAVFVGAVLVGIGEEVTFRGLVLGGLAQQFSLPVAVIGSSMLFGLMHSVNVLAGEPVKATVVQVILATIVGTMFGWTYVFSGGSLVLLVVLHCLHDFSLFAAPLLSGKPNPLAAPEFALALIAAAALMIVGVAAF